MIYHNLSFFFVVVVCFFLLHLQFQLHIFVLRIESPLRKKKKESFCENGHFVCVESNEMLLLTSRKCGPSCPLTSGCRCR